MPSTGVTIERTLDLLAQLDPDNPPPGLGRLLVLFLMAIVIVSPFAIRTFRRSRSTPGTDGAEPITPTPPTVPTLEATIAAIRSLERDHRGTAEVFLHRSLSSGGRGADRRVVDGIVGDALARSGWRVDHTSTVEDGTVLHCVPVEPEPNHSANDEGSIP